MGSDQFVFREFAIDKVETRKPTPFTFSFREKAFYVENTTPLYEVSRTFAMPIPEKAACAHVHDFDATYDAVTPM